MTASPSDFGARWRAPARLDLAGYYAAGGGWPFHPAKLRASAATKRIPVIMLTAKNTEYDRVVGLDGGADDYIAKPFGMMELMAWVRAVLRRTEQKQETEDYQVGDLFVSPQRHVVRVAGRRFP